MRARHFAILALFMSFVASPAAQAAPVFTPVSTGLPDLHGGSAEWGDYDNDGDLDVLVSGLTGPGSETATSRIYRNNGGANPTFTDIGAGLLGVFSSGAAWGDYDRDGDLDLLLTGSDQAGQRTARIYRNGGGANPSFTDIAAGLLGVESGTAAWGDYDNDGDLDILLTGNSSSGHLVRIYQSSGGTNPTFAGINPGIPGAYLGCAAWGDYDKDGDLDIMASGMTGNSRFAGVYRSSGGPNPSFSNINAGLSAVSSSSMAWGDYDADGDLDILLAGFDGTINISRIYRNNGGANPTFTDIVAGLTGVFSASIRWGDVANDGDLDVLIVGHTGSTRVAKVYISSGGANPTFTDAIPGLTGVDTNAAAWGDYDNDHDLDLLVTGHTGTIGVTKLYQVSGVTANTKPDPPSNLSAFFDLTHAYFSWSPATDEQTASPGLTYNLRIGRSPGSGDIVSSMAGVTGRRRVVAFGNSNHRTSWDITLPEPGRYYWSVQAIDGTFEGSAFAQEEELCVTGYAEIASGLPGLTESSVAWGDYDQDGDLDLLAVGMVFGGGTVSRIYRNDGGPGPTLTDIGAGLQGVRDASGAWGDYDRDGDLDILLTGWNGAAFSALYRNSGGPNPTFSNVGAGLPGVYESSVAWGDYDNDGDLDILYTGLNNSATPISRVYRNSGGPNPTFSDAAVGLIGVSNSSVAWGDYDKDGDLDILLTGANPARTSIVYRNSGGMNPTFTDIGPTLPVVFDSAVAWGDYDNDGDLDILLTGFSNSGSISRVYRNSGGANPTFSDIGAGLTGVRMGAAAWGDYDNDGDLDIHISGWNGQRWSLIYRNTGGANPMFAGADANLTGIETGSSAWGDCDGDGDLDLLVTGYIGGSTAISKLYRNECFPANTPPGAPTNLSYSRAGNRATFAWNAPTDAQTPSSGLSYNLRVGSSPGAGDIVSAMALGSGTRNIPALGNTGPRTSWEIELPGAGDFYWSVQAIDGAYAGSAFAGEVSICTAGYSDAAAGLTGVATASMAWGDYDNDGDLDILSIGYNSSTSIAKIYRNSGGANPTFSNIGAALYGVSYGSVAWGDYDSDGDLDIVITGLDGQTASGTAKIYRSSGGPNPTFTDIGAALIGTYLGSSAWGDCDSDGDLDLLITGFDNTIPTTKLYRNSGGTNPTFTDMGAGLTGVYYSGGTAWCDYDKDGDLDIILSGNDVSETPITRLYRNSGGSNPTFSDAGAGLPNVMAGSMSWGDYDNDGDPDLLLTGSDSGGTRLTRLYRNSGGANPTFADAGLGLPGVYVSSTAWGDYDNDGFLDLLLSGINNSFSSFTRLYRSSGGANPTFSDAGAPLPNVHWSSLTWGDYDNDNDLDILLGGTNGPSYLAGVYRNACVPSNAPPLTPGNLSVNVNGTQATFSWNASTDAQSPAAALSYNLRLGTSPGAGNVVSPMSAADGYRRIAATGNTGQRTSRTVELPGSGPWYWSVQAIDGALAGSPFAAEQVLGQSGIPDPSVGTSYALWNAGPNPFSRATTIHFSQPTRGPVSLDIFDVAGRCVRRLESSELEAGSFTRSWDATDDAGRSVPSGLYFVRLRAGAVMRSYRLSVVR